MLIIYLFTSISLCRSDSKSLLAAIRDSSVPDSSSSSSCCWVCLTFRARFQLSLFLFAALDNVLVVVDEEAVDEEVTMVDVEVMASGYVAVADETEVPDVPMEAPHDGCTCEIS